MVHHRHKHRILTTIISLIVLVFCFDIFLLFDRFFTVEISLLVSFGVGIFLLTLYHVYGYRHCHEHITMINNLTQIYFGVILLMSIILLLLLRWIFQIEIITAYLILSLLVIITIFLTLGPYDRFLEQHMGTRFPLNAPTPSNKLNKFTTSTSARSPVKTKKR